jgi:vacuolar protein sorting-associated protein 35
MLKIPIDLYKNVLKLLKFKHYMTLFEHLDHAGRKSMCRYIVNNALNNETLISTPEDVEGLLQIINPIIVITKDAEGYEEDDEDFADEQTLVARLIHLMKSDNLDEQFIVRQLL